MTDIQRRLNNMRGGTASITDRLNTMRNSGESFKETEKAETKENPLFTPAEDGFFEGLAILPSSPQQALKDIGYTTERLGAGLLGALEGVTDIMNVGLGKAVQGVTSLGGLLPNPVSEWGKEWAENALNTSPTQQWEESIRERYNPSKGAENLSGVGQTIAQMFPAIGVGSAISAGGSALNAAQAASKGANVGRAIMGAQAAGNAASEAAAEVADTNQALAYGLTSGLLETTIESIAGGIPGLGRGKIGEIADAVKANPIISRVLDIAGEGGEEALSTVLSPYLKRAIYDPDAESATAEEIAQSAILGAVAAGVLQAGLELPTAVSDTMSDIRRVRQEVGSNQDIINRANQRIAQDLQARREAANPLLPRFQTAGDVQSDGTTVQRDNRLYLPGSDQGQEAVRNNNTAPESGAVIQDYQRHGVLTTSESGTPLFQSEATSQGADVPLRNDMPLGEPEGSPTNNSILPGGQDVNIQAVSPDSSVGAAPAENRTSPVRMSLDEYLGRRGLRAPFSDFMDDKLRLPHGETARQRVARERAANQAADDYQNRRAQAIREYQAAVENGEIVAPTRTERLLRIAQGNADNESVQAARRSLERRGINWRSEGDTGPLSLTLPGRPEDVYDIYGSGAENLPENAVGANKASPWAEFVASSKEFFPEGANAARDVDVPTTDPQGRRIRRTASTAMGAKAIPDEVVGDIQNMVLRGELSYDRVSDKSSINRAIKTIQDKGYQGALEEFRSSVNKGVISKDIATLGQQLLINAANAGDSRTTAELLSLYAQMETTAGQAVQAASILRKLDPSAQLYAAQRVVNDLEKVLRKNYKDLDITIDQALLDEFAAQTTQEGRDAVMDRIYQNVADQVPSTWRDKWNAWRYLAMLANPRTHIRNVAGNLFFQPLRIVKDRTAAAIEAGLSKAGVNIERTKSFAASPDLYKAAWNDWQNVKDVLSGNKYDDVRSEINSRRRVFRTAPLEAARTGNSWALEFEDSIFKRITYADALAGYLQANGVSSEQVKNNTVDAQLMARARDYAGQEALRATYQDRNRVSDKVVEVARALGPFGEAVLPFKRTPANILVRGLEYSPAGLAKALTADLVQVKQGKISAAQAIDHIAAGLTGSALFALGAYLFIEGLVTSGGGDDENQDRINDLTGQQNYALNLPGGGNVTLDWLAPEALPFFMGVELMDSLGQNGNTSESIMNALQSISEPMLELSMLQSLNDIIDSVSFSENKLGAMAASSVISYFTQAIPTIGGQIERSLEDTRMSTYTDKNLKLPTDVQYALGRASARIPLPYVDYQQIPYIDAWGRREDSGPLWLRTANNFLNPAYTSNSEVTPVDEEIQRLYDETGESGVVPDRPQRYITVDGERIDLSAEQYTQYAEERGQMQFSMLEGLVDSSAYQRLSDTDKAAIVSDVYSYADAVTKSHISDYEPEGWIAKVVESGADPAEYILYKHSLTDGMTLKERSAALERSGITGREKTDLLLAENPEWTEKAREYGVSDRVYVEFKVATSDVSADKDEDGKSVSGSKKKKVMDIIDGMDVSDEVKDSLYYAAGYTESTIDDAPWR